MISRDSKLINLIDSNKDSFDSIVDSINNYRNFISDENYIENPKFQEVLNECVFGLIRISDIIIKYGNYRDKWDNSYYSQSFHGPKIYIHSLKTNCKYIFGLNEFGITLSAELYNYQNLNYMGDDFWKLLLQLYDFKGFSYNPYEKVSSNKVNEFPEHFKSNKSIIFSILRKYIYDCFEKDKTRNHFRSVGLLSITFDNENGLYDLLINSCLSFKILYKLNYSLWKVTELKASNY